MRVDHQTIDMTDDRQVGGNNKRKTRISNRLVRCSVQDLMQI